ncbi:MAG TPA: ABC transporter permease [Methylomirabilota bacterium]|nr:ABC transporter permease [Methylomirabilota bacterium]
MRGAEPVLQAGAAGARRGLAAPLGELLGRVGRYRRLLLFSPIMLFFGTFFLFPLFALLRVSLARNPGGTGYGEGTAFYIPGTWTLDNYVKFFGDRFFLQTALFTVELGLITAVATTVVSYALAYQVYRARPLVKSVLLMVVILPKFTNVLVMMYGFLVVFGSSGLLNRMLLLAGVVREPVPMVYNLFSVVLGEIVLVMPYCVLVIAAVLHGIDPALAEAARGLGATPARVFREVTLPLSLPGVWVSVLLSYIWGVGAFVAPYLLGNPELYTLAVEVDRQTNWRLNWAMGGTVAFVLMAIILALVVLFVRAQGEARQEAAA